MYDEIKKLIAGQSMRTVVNILRCRFETMETAYLELNNTTKPVCDNCGGVVKFLGFFKGFKNVCVKCEKEKRNYRVANKIRNISVESFIEFYYKNLDC